MSREAIAQSADLQRRYLVEYASMLRTIGDRELAREAARVNLSAILIGQERIVPSEKSLGIERLREAFTRSGDDLDAIRRTFSRVVERTAPTRETARFLHERDSGRR